MKKRHSCSFDDVRILATEPNYNARKIKEAIEIYRDSPLLTRTMGMNYPPSCSSSFPPTRTAPDTTPGAASELV